jgi:hypothetical protein
MALEEVGYAQEHDRRRGSGAGGARHDVAAPPTGAATGTSPARRRNGADGSAEPEIEPTVSRRRESSAGQHFADHDQSPAPAGTRRRPTLIEEWHRLTVRYCWDHFVTLTFAVPASPERAHRTFQEYVRKLTSVACGPVGWVYVVDRGRSDRVHIHALLAGTAELCECDMKRFWRHGKQVDIRVYDEQQGAAKYLVAKIGIPDGTDTRELEYSNLRAMRRRTR